MNLTQFWERVSIGGPDDCWPWLGVRTYNGYGRFKLTARKSPVRAHRLAYEEMVGPIPEGLVIDHLCRNRLCVNPDHLEPVTNRENLLRGEGIAAINAAKTHCVKGHPFDEVNTYIEPSNGKRKCRTCRRADGRCYRARQKQT